MKSRAEWSDLSERVRGLLAQAGFGPATDFTRVASRDLVRIPGLGPAALKEIRTHYPLAPVGETVVPKHGRGQLLAGGKPGNKGGGRRPSEVRQLFRDDALVAREHIMAALDQKYVCPECKRPPMATDELIRAFSAFGRFGLGEAKGIDREQLGELLVDLAEDVQEVVAEPELLGEIHRRWRARIRNRVTL